MSMHRTLVNSVAARICEAKGILLIHESQGPFGIENTACKLYITCLFCNSGRGWGLQDLLCELIFRNGQDRDLWSEWCHKLLCVCRHCCTVKNDWLF